jgi:hypothetical protein
VVDRIARRFLQFTVLTGPSLVTRLRNESNREPSVAVLAPDNNLVFLRLETNKVNGQISKMKLAAEFDNTGSGGRARKIFSGNIAKQLVSDVFQHDKGSRFR